MTRTDVAIRAAGDAFRAGITDPKKIADFAIQVVNECDRLGIFNTPAPIAAPSSNPIQPPSEGGAN